MEKPYREPGRLRFLAPGTRRSWIPRLEGKSATVQVFSLDAAAAAAILSSAAEAVDDTTVHFSSEVTTVSPGDWGAYENFRAMLPA